MNHSTDKLMKAKVAWSKFRDYVRHNLKQTTFPSSLQDPPHVKDRPKLTWTARYYVVKQASRKFRDYIRYDLKEIAFPSSLPDPPHVKKRRKLTWTERYYVLKEASRLYCASWVRDIGPELRPHEYKKEANDDDLDGGKAESKGKEPSALEDLAVAARGGMETLRPALQRLYMTRASGYKDALKNFIGGYQEGIQEVMKKNEDSKSEREDDTFKKSS